MSIDLLNGYWVSRRSLLPLFGIVYEHNVRRLADHYASPSKHSSTLAPTLVKPSLQTLHDFPQARILALEPHPSMFFVLSNTIGHAKVRRLLYFIAILAGTKLLLEVPGIKMFLCAPALIH
jgi:hypothetical protein